MMRALVLGSGLALVVLLLGGAYAEAGGALKAVEEEFRAAIQRVAPATVVVIPRGVRGDAAGFSSGVIVSANGLVLSDGDAGLVWRREGDEIVKSWRSRVDVRVPQPKTGTFVTYRGRVLRRDTSVDTSMIQLERVPAGGLPFVQPGRSNALRVGDFAFVVGSSSFTDGGTTPTLTAGVVAAFDELAPGDPAGPHEFVYVSAAINEGVNGGPLVDLEGRLVGTVSTYLEPGPTQRYQYLGKAVPMDRIRAALSGVAEARTLFRAEPPPDTPSSLGHTLEDVFHDAVEKAGPSVVSITVERKQPLSGRAPLGDDTIEVPRYVGPVSGVAVSKDGLVVTSLYNVTNPGQLVDPLWSPSPEDEIATGLANIVRATVHYPSGLDAPASFVGHDPRTGLALFRAEMVATDAVTVPEAAPATALQRGRFVLALGNPFGEKRRSDALLTLGILSKRHATTAPVAWRDQWQTDAAGLDTNAGGAAVDIEGRVLGMMQLWHPGRHGRASGIAFVVPWSRVESSVRDIVEDRVPGPAFLGVQFGRRLEPILASVEDGHAARAAGLQPGDRLLAIDGEEVPTMVEAITAIRMRYEGESVRVRFERDGAVYERDVVLGRRP